MLGSCILQCIYVAGENLSLHCSGPFGYKLRDPVFHTALSWNRPSHSCLKFFKWCAQVCVLLNCIWSCGREQRRELSVSRGCCDMWAESPLSFLKPRQRVLCPSGWCCRPVGSGSSAAAKVQASVLSRGSPKHVCMLFLCAWQFGITSFSF